MNSEITHVLQRIDAGDPSGTEQLLSLVYDELRRLAASRMASEGASQTLQPTALVHEAYLRLLSGDRPPSWESRAHFFGAAAEAMRRILIDRARSRRAEKRGGLLRRQELHRDDAQLEPEDNASLLALDEALTKLAQLEPELAQLVKLRYFTGLTIEEVSEVLQVSTRTAKRNWAYARAWLRRAMDGE